jgi:hypothetical protein
MPKSKLRCHSILLDKQDMKHCSTHFVIQLCSTNLDLPLLECFLVELGELDVSETHRKSVGQNCLPYSMVRIEYERHSGHSWFALPTQITEKNFQKLLHSGLRIAVGIRPLGRTLVRAKNYPTEVSKLMKLSHTFYIISLFFNSFVMFLFQPSQHALVWNT